jgi:NAD(P)-dependent dehydrogenase (short-subunit alcohol dehydrogenase family)
VRAAARLHQGESDVIEPQLAGQTVVVIGGSSGLGFETAKLARERGARVILTARNVDRLHAAGLALGAGIAAFDAGDFGRLERFLRHLPGLVDHVMVAARGRHYEPLAELLPRRLPRAAAAAVRPGGTLLLVGSSPVLPALTESLAVELAPVRVNLIAPGLPDAAERAVELMADERRSAN